MRISEVLKDTALGFAVGAGTLVWGGYLQGGFEDPVGVIWVVLYLPSAGACAGLTVGALVTTLSPRGHRQSSLLVGGVVGMAFGFLAEAHRCLRPWLWDEHDIHGLFPVFAAPAVPFLIAYFAMCALGRLLIGKQQQKVQNPSRVRKRKRPTASPPPSPPGPDITPW